MRRQHFLIILLLTSSLCFSQSYLGWITKQVNFRIGPGTDYELISVLKPGTQIFIESLDSENDFYTIIDIATNKEGFVHKSFIKLGKVVNRNEKGLFSPTGETTSIDSEVEIFNNTDLILTLKLEDEIYSFLPNERRKLILTPGKYNYRASAPGVIPNIGAELLNGKTIYTWQFYVVTRRR